MSSKGSAQDGLKFVTSVSALLRVDASPMISDLIGEAVSDDWSVALSLGGAGNLSLNRSKREDDGLDGGGDVFNMSANGRDGSAGGSMLRPVIEFAVLNLTARARLNAVDPSKYLMEDDNGRVSGPGAGDDGACGVPCDIQSTAGCQS